MAEAGDRVKIILGSSIVRPRNIVVLTEAAQDESPRGTIGEALRVVVYGLTCASFIALGILSAVANPTAFAIGFTQGFVMTSVATRGR